MKSLKKDEFRLFSLQFIEKDQNFTLLSTAFVSWFLTKLLEVFQFISDFENAEFILKRYIVDFVELCADAQRVSSGRILKDSWGRVAVLTAKVVCSHEALIGLLVTDK